MRDEENLFNILTEIGNCIEEPISPCDVDVCHRVPVPNDRASKNIIVQFIHRRKRNAVLEAAKKKKLTCEDLGLSHTAPIFINEHLCPDRKRLLGQAIAKKREAGWKFVWVRNGNIYARKSEKSNALKIGSASDLVKMT